MTELKTLKDIERESAGYLCDENTNEVFEENPNFILPDEARALAIKWVKLIRSMKYGQRLCLNCMKIYGGGNGGQQYCCRGKDGELHFIEEQTGSSIGAVEILMKTNNISEDDLK